MVILIGRNEILKLKLIFVIRYMIHFLLDSSFGLLMIFFGIRFSQHIARVKNWESFNFGEYGMRTLIYEA